MKLKHQLNFSFIALIFIVLGLAAYVFYSLLLNMLIDNQFNELRAKGQAFVNEMKGQKEEVIAEELKRLSAPPGNAGNINVLLVNMNEKKLLFSSLSSEATNTFSKKLQYDPSKALRGVWNTSGGQYVAETFQLISNDGRMALVLATPLTGLKELQWNIAVKLFLILGIGGIIAFILSTIITRRLVTPLSHVNTALKQMTKRQFDDIENVKAGGEIGEVAVSVSQMAEELKKYMNTQTYFFQNASHELKSPLMTIRGYAEGIKDGVFSGREAQEGLKLIINESDRMKALVTEMVLLAKLETEENIYHVRQVSVKEVMSKAVERLTPLVNESHKIIHIHDCLEELGLIQADADKLMQAFLNILSNALRHANKMIEIKYYNEKGYIKVDIADDGPGISNEILPYIFHRFIKGSQGQTGLGLAISRAIVEGCGGDISACNQETGGAVFTLSFPKA
ncbi:signal transduction histidine kinase [Scopulibacillus daqui]|uniref:histidine kinase n=1 Tax=Scopulibacillus daqui TaxID=1469162 RepID=A0ABS2Q2M0_9BACL|nr:HAMP domain-containing sensor histidine kinase [Scopulibacillus daqui]MBM7646535.1 signal transduction histidine kinase [Scopulibacillus daqui]